MRVTMSGTVTSTCGSLEPARSWLVATVFPAIRTLSSASMGESMARPETLNRSFCPGLTSSKWRSISPGCSSRPLMVSGAVAVSLNLASSTVPGLSFSTASRPRVIRSTGAGPSRLVFGVRLTSVPVCRSALRRSTASVVPWSNPVPTGVTRISLPAAAAGGKTVSTSVRSPILTRNGLLPGAL